MALEEYKRKRDFTKTAEPKPRAAKARRRELSYLIQKHDASRLHYDFRLEHDGVLLSWAVTKGPSLNPADKRLAVRTEDHPLDYGGFEGTIPKDQYGGGTVMLWDQGTWLPKEDPHAGLRKGHLSFILHGQKLKGGWDLIRMRNDGKRENWLLIKAKDDEASGKPNAAFLETLSYSVKSGRSMLEIAGHSTPAKSKAKQPARKRSDLTGLIRRYPSVELATLVEEPPAGDQWLHEIKLDGYRLLGFLSGNATSLRTRNGKDWSEKFPAILDALAKLKADDAVVDMEAVVLDAKGRSSFQALQGALGESGKSSKIIAYVFDLLHLDGDDLTHVPLLDRKQKLEALLKDSNTPATLRYSEHIAGDGRKILAKSCKMGLEGILSKLADSPYQAGRQRAWLKSKCAQRQEFIIIGYSDARSGDRAIGAVYLGYQKNGRMHYAGKAGTGFTMKSARSIATRFRSLSQKHPLLTREEMRLSASEWRSVHWIKPELLCEVAFTEWTKDGQLRHPSFQGLREDKDAAEVKKEDLVPAKVAEAAPSAAKTSPLVLHGINVTNPGRVISETGQITKGELAEYYAAVAPLMLPGIVRRPLSLLRCPSGISKQCFYQRNPGKGLGPDVHPFEFKNNGKRYEYLYIEDEKGLLELIQMGSIEIHPWGASIDSIDFPDRMIFDLDPAPDVPFEALKMAAQDLRQRLKKKGHNCLLKCTGGKGLHVTVPLPGKDKWPEVKSFAASIAAEMVEAAPQAYVATMSKAKRTGKIFIDYFRNDYTATAIAAYSVRALPGAPVALPLEWKELDTLESPSQFTIRDVLKRLKKER